MTKRIAFVDNALMDYQALIASLDPGVEVVLISPTQEGWTQMAEGLAGHNGADAIDIFSHGAPVRVGVGLL